MTKKLVGECLDLLDAKEMIFDLISNGHKVIADPYNGKVWVFDCGIPRK